MSSAGSQSAEGPKTENSTVISKVRDEEESLQIVDRSRPPCDGILGDMKKEAQPEMSNSGTLKRACTIPVRRSDRLASLPASRFPNHTAKNGH